jgi:hypothetical protein
MGCPAVEGLPNGYQLCTTTVECVTPGSICAFPLHPGLKAEYCEPGPDDGGITDGAADASLGDGATMDANGAPDAIFLADVTGDAPGQ